MADNKTSEVFNQTMDYSTDEELAALDLFQNYPTGLVEFAAACCILFTIVGVPGNFVTMVALIRCKRIRNATAIFIINLSFCDLLYCAINLPLVASSFILKYWPFGITMCKVFPLLRFGLSAVSLCTILAITISRYILISHPNLYNKLYKKSWNLAIQIIIIWTFSFTCLIPTLLEVWGRFGIDNLYGICSLLPDENNRSPSTLIFIAAFLIPAISIAVGYTKIYLTVRKTTRRSKSTANIKRVTMFDDSSIGTSTERTPASGDKEPTSKGDRLSQRSLKTRWSNFLLTSGITKPDQSEEVTTDPMVQEKRNSSLRTTVLCRPAPERTVTSKDKRLLTMFSAIITAFLICHLPLTVFKIYGELKPHPIPFIISTLLRYLTSCINPIIYVVMSKEYRKAYKKAFHCDKRNNNLNCFVECAG